jgi:hypothetical protein
VAIVRVFVPAGTYGSETTRLSYTMGQQRRVSGRVSVAQGTLYNGTRTEATYSGRWGVLPQLSIEPAVRQHYALLRPGCSAQEWAENRRSVLEHAKA